MIYEKEHKINNTISLDEISLNYLNDIYNYSNDTEFCKYLSFKPSLENTKIFIENTITDIYNKKRLYWVIKYDDKIIGTIGLLNFNRNLSSAEIGFGISKLYWGKGIINKCLDYLIYYSFYDLGIVSLNIGTNINNNRAINFIKNIILQKIRNAKI